MAIFVNADTKVIVQGLTGGQGKYHGLRNRAYGTQVVGGVTPGKGGQDVEGDPDLRHRRRGRRRDRCHRVVHRRAAEGRIGGDPRSRRGRHRVRRVHHRGHPGPGRGQGVQHAWCATSPTRGCSARTARHHQPGQVQHRHHGRRDRPAADSRRTERRHRLALGNAHLSGAVRAQAARHRRVDLRRHRWRSGARHQLHRLPQRVPGRPRDPGDDPDRRDRRLGRGRGGRLHRVIGHPSR